MEGIFSSQLIVFIIIKQGKIMLASIKDYDK